jgi:6-phosphogluconolactonase
MSQDSMPQTPIAPYDSADTLLADLVDAFVDLAKASIRQRGVFRVSLSGGSTPKRLYESLAKTDLDFSRVQWFWGDERNVPHDHPESNFRMVDQAMLKPAGVAAECIFAVPVDVAHPAAAAREYESTLRRQFAGATMTYPTGTEPFPAWDLVLLGMGDDAHTASLFPDTAALDVCDRWFVENWVEKFAAYRYTLTAPAINSGRQIWFLITGVSKREAVARVLGAERNPRIYPSQLIRPTRYFITSDALPPAAAV